MLRTIFQYASSTAVWIIVVMLRTIFLSSVAVIWVIVIDVEKYFSSLMLRTIFLSLLYGQLELMLRIIYSK